MWKLWASVPPIILMACSCHLPHYRNRPYSQEQASRRTVASTQKKNCHNVRKYRQKLNKRKKKPPLFTSPFQKVSLVEGHHPSARALLYLNARRLSSACPAGLLTGTVAVDGPCSPPFHFAGLIGREKFPRRERLSKGLCLFTRLRAVNN